MPVNVADELQSVRAQMSMLNLTQELYLNVSGLDRYALYVYAWLALDSGRERSQHHILLNMAYGIELMEVDRSVLVKLGLFGKVRIKMILYDSIASLFGQRSFRKHICRAVLSLCEELPDLVFV